MYLKLPFFVTFDKPINLGLIIETRSINVQNYIDMKIKSIFSQTNAYLHYRTATLLNLALFTLSNFPKFFALLYFVILCCCFFKDTSINYTKSI